MKRAILSIAMMIGLVQAAPAVAAADDPNAALKDVHLDALPDEMIRSLKYLRLLGHDTPYFISYPIKEIDQGTLSSCLGSPPVLDHLRYRVLMPQVRVGNYELDSSLPVTSRKVYISQMTTDDDYKAIRRSAWLSTDYSYIAAVQMYEWKKAFLRSNVI